MWYPLRTLISNNQVIIQVIIYRGCHEILNQCIILNIIMKFLGNSFEVHLKLQVSQSVSQLVSQSAWPFCVTFNLTFSQTMNNVFLFVCFFFGGEGLGHFFLLSQAKILFLFPPSRLEKKGLRYCFQQVWARIYFLKKNHIPPRIVNGWPLTNFCGYKFCGLSHSHQWCLWRSLGHSIHLKGWNVR